MKTMLNLLIFLIVAYAGITGFLYVFQRRLMYHPDAVIESPDHYLQGFTEHFVTASDGVRIQLWYHQARQGFPTIVYYHGNASNLAARAGIYEALAGKGFGLVAVEYRGFGKSGGSPTEQGLYNDARAGLRFATDEQHIPIGRVILYGESLGTGVAVQMATEYNVGMLVLEAAYTSVAARAAQIYYYIPVRLLIHDTFDSLSKIGRVKAPLLLFHGERDQTIPIAMGKALFAAATSPKQAVYFPNVGHNDFDSGVLAAHVLDFAQKQGLIIKAN